MPYNTRFGDATRELRKQREIGLREFCIKSEEDASNWSKIERGIMEPPLDEGRFAKIADALDLAPESAEIQNLRDLAHAHRGVIPKEALAEDEFVAMLPMFFRTLRGDKPGEAELERFYGFLREKYNK